MPHRSASGSTSWSALYIPDTEVLNSAQLSVKRVKLLLEETGQQCQPAGASARSNGRYALGLG